MDVSSTVCRSHHVGTAADPPVVGDAECAALSVGGAMAIKEQKVGDSLVAGEPISILVSPITGMLLIRSTSGSVVFSTAERSATELRRRFEMHISGRSVRAHRSIQREASRPGCVTQRGEEIARRRRLW